MILLFVRFAGIAAAFATSWQLGLLTMLPILLVKEPRAKCGFDLGAGGRILAEFVTLGIGIYAIYVFPYVAPNTAMVAALIAGVLVATQLASLFNARRY